MMGKLIKNDLKAGIRQVSNIYLAELIAMGAMLASSFFKSGLLKFVTSAAVVIIAGIAIIITFVTVVFGVNKTLFGRQGYLTQTLPVRTSSMIFSKWLTASFWVTVSFVVFGIAFIGVFVYWTTKDQSGSQMYNMIYAFAQGLGLGEESIVRTYVIINAFIGLFNSCVFVMFIIFATTLANTRPLNKLGTFGIILYFALTFGIVQAAAWELEKLCDVTLIIRETGFSMTVSQAVISEALCSGALTIGFTGVYFKTIVTLFIYILTVWLTETKINLK